MSATSSSLQSAPQLTGWFNARRNLGEFFRFQNQFAGLQHLSDFVSGQTTDRANFWRDVPRAIARATWISLSTPRYRGCPFGHKVKDLTKPSRPCPVIDYDLFLVTKTVAMTGVLDPKLIREIMNSNRQMDDHPFVTSDNYDRIRWVIGSGQFFSARGDQYKTLRTFFHQIFSPKNLYENPRLGAELSRFSLATIEIMRMQKTVPDVTEATFGLPSYVIQTILFGKVLPNVRESMWEINRLIKKFVSNLNKSGDAEALLERSEYKNLKKLAADIKEHPETYPGLISKGVQELKLAEDEVFSLMLFLLFAGEDTLSSAITSMLYELGGSSDIQEKLREATRSYFDENNAIDLKTLDHIPYLDWVVREIFRLYPAIPSLLRSINQRESNVALGDYQLEKGRSLAMVIWTANRHPDYWYEATSFIPERWDPKRQKEFKTDPKYMLSFGKGPNKCLGEHLARLELKSLIFEMVNRCCWKREKEVVFDAGATLCSVEPIAITIDSL